MITFQHAQPPVGVDHRDAQAATAEGLAQPLAEALGREALPAEGAAAVLGGALLGGALLEPRRHSGVAAAPPPPPGPCPSRPSSSRRRSGRAGGGGAPLQGRRSASSIARTSRSCLTRPTGHCARTAGSARTRGAGPPEHQAAARREVDQELRELLRREAAVEVSVVLVEHAPAVLLRELPAAPERPQRVERHRELPRVEHAVAVRVELGELRVRPREHGADALLRSQRAPRRRLVLDIERARLALVCICGHVCPRRHQRHQRPAWHRRCRRRPRRGLLRQRRQRHRCRSAAHS